MEIGDIKYKGDTYTWANNREGEDFIEERLDRSCGSVKWMRLNDTAVVNRVFRPASYHSLIILESKPKRVRTRARFVFFFKWDKRKKVREVKKTWGKTVVGSRMLKVK